MPYRNLATVDLDNLPKLNLAGEMMDSFTLFSKQRPDMAKSSRHTITGRLATWLTVPLLTGMLTLLAVADSAGQSLNTRFTTSFYSWERYLTESETQNHFRVYQTLQFTLGQMANNKLSLHFYGLASGDVSNHAEDDVVPRLYATYLQWREPKGLVKRVRVGRQRIYSGVAYGTIDGADLEFRFGKYITAGGFAGALVPFTNTIEISKWDDSNMFGVRLGIADLLGTRVLLSYAQRNRLPAAYPAPGRFTEQRITFDSREQSLVGLDVYRTFSNRVNAYGRFDYDLEQERVRRGQVELRLAASQRWEVSAEFFHRAPLLEANSIFVVFEQYTSQDILGRVSYRLPSGWTFYGDAGVQLYQDDETLRFGVGARCRYGYLGYNFRRGYGGLNNGLYAALTYPVSKRLTAMLTTGFSRYSLYSTDAEKYTALLGTAGFNYRTSRKFSFDVTAQGLHNKNYNDDLRLFARANYWFVTKF
jgi:hypothetical protein